ncbi:right-handed parallel beta-helix repeat-containing protein [Dyella sp.]|uniref:right-handed parallel beta-helix repeat-containing protein n=1 Tax=Dyella sp. TaxID=1869338 RepID=UPI002B479C8F|nr:right-handed parallel beta-helix repeat-containing protein [Dyella sp.]HKT29566.1 right-handed parallel beta-helix repeat-containing protein [Dyella sp.]
MKRLAGIGASLALLSVALPAAATQWWSQTPYIYIGPTVVNVTNFGANGNGVMDDTAAFQAAINALPANGGTIVVPNGTYMIDATKGINLRSNVRLSLWSGATLKAIPNNASFAAVVKVWNASNVEILGGHIEGERYHHLGTNGLGYGISIQESSTVYVHDITVADSWGDGVLVGTTSGWRKFTPVSNITLNRVTSTNSRRQALTITGANQVYVVNSNLNGSNGTAPQAGIDIEPQTLGTATSIRIEKSAFSNNMGCGLEVHDAVNGLTVTGNTAKANHGYGVFTLGATNVTITNNWLTQNYLFGVDIDAGTQNVSLGNNTINYNGAAWLVAHGESVFTLGYVLRDITISGSASGVTQYGNTITPMKQ